MSPTGRLWMDYREGIAEGAFGEQTVCLSLVYEVK
jgi:hypothetical protein